MSTEQPQTPRKTRVVPATYHRWTESDEQLIRDHYGPLSPEPWQARRLARLIGTTVRSLQRMVRLRGLSRQGRGMAPIHRIRAWWQLGATDMEISGLLGCQRQRVTVWRWRRGLPPNRAQMGRPRRRPAVNLVDQVLQPAVGLAGCGRGAE
jgi:hypothetical protein